MVSRALERLVAGWGGLLAMAAWGFGEAILLPIVPDVGLYPLLATDPRRAARLFVAVVVGAVLGTLVLYAVATARPEVGRSIVLAVPGIDGALLDEATAATASGEPTAMLVVGPGTPLKAFTVGWAAGPGDATGLVLGAIFNRLTRIGPGVLLAAAAGLLAGSWLRRRAGPLLVAYAAAWAIFYWRFLGAG